jgi:hypothetical protein
LGIGDWGLGIGPNPQSPIPNPQSPIPNFEYAERILYKNKIIINFKRNKNNFNIYNFFRI